MHDDHFGGIGEKIPRIGQPFGHDPPPQPDIFRDRALCLPRRKDRIRPPGDDERFKAHPFHKIHPRDGGIVQFLPRPVVQIVGDIKIVSFPVHPIDDAIVDARRIRRAAQQPLFCPRGPEKGVLLRLPFLPERRPRKTLPVTDEDKFRLFFISLPPVKFTCRVSRENARRRHPFFTSEGRMP